MLLFWFWEEIILGGGYGVEVLEAAESALNVFFRGTASCEPAGWQSSSLLSLLLLLFLLLLALLLLLPLLLLLLLLLLLSVSSPYTSSSSSSSSRKYSQEAKMEEANPPSNPQSDTCNSRKLRHCRSACIQSKAACGRRRSVAVVPLVLLCVVVVMVANNCGLKDNRRDRKECWYLCMTRTRSGKEAEVNWLSLKSNVQSRAWGKAGGADVVVVDVAGWWLLLLWCEWVCSVPNKARKMGATPASPNRFMATSIESIRSGVVVDKDVVVLPCLELLEVLLLLLLLPILPFRCCSFCNAFAKAIPSVKFPVPVPPPTVPTPFPVIFNTRSVLLNLGTAYCSPCAKAVTLSCPAKEKDKWISRRLLHCAKWWKKSWIMILDASLLLWLLLSLECPKLHFNTWIVFNEGLFARACHTAWHASTWFCDKVVDDDDDDCTKSNCTIRKWRIKGRTCNRCATACALSSKTNALFQNKVSVARFLRRRCEAAACSAALRGRRGNRWTGSSSVAR